MPTLSGIPHQMRRVVLVATLSSVGLAVSASAQLTLHGSHWWPYSHNGARQGESVATGDFNGDGREDLAVGSPNQTLNALADTGLVGLRTDADASSASWMYLSWCLDPSDQGAGDLTGTSVVFGDFNADGFDDLAFGKPGADVFAVDEAGVVCIAYGGEVPLADAPRQKLTQVELEGSPQTGDRFGEVLAAGDLNYDGYDDLAISAPGETIGGFANAGAVHVVFGGELGLTAANDVLLYQGSSPGTNLEPGVDEFFGSALAIGNFAGTISGPGAQNPYLDLAVGNPGDSHEGVGSGSVLLYYGSPSPFPVMSVYSVEDPARDLVGTAELGDGFGSALAPGDFNGDGRTDLAVAIPNDDDFGVTDAGAVMVLYRNNSSLSDFDEQVFFEGLTGGVVTGFDRFGTALTAGDFNGDETTDLAIGSPLDNALGVVDSGKVTILYGSDGGLGVEGLQELNLWLFGGVQLGDQSGFAMAAGDFYPGQGETLVAGAPGRTAGQGGVMYVRSSNLFQDGFESGDFEDWTSQVP